jgi:hypothetical protein
VLSDEYPGAYYAPHHRSYGLRAIESYQEMLDLGEATGCPVRESRAGMHAPDMTTLPMQRTGEITATESDTRLDPRDAQLSREPG